MYTKGHLYLGIFPPDSCFVFKNQFALDDPVDKE